MAKRMKADPHCQQQNCSPLNVLFSDIYIYYIDVAGRSSTIDQNKNTLGKNCDFSTFRYDYILQMVCNTATVTISHQ